MEKITLVFQRTECDYETAWVNTKLVEVEVPDYLLRQDKNYGPFHLTGAKYEDDNDGLKKEADGPAEHDSARGGRIAVYYEKYRSDSSREYVTETFGTLDEVADWIFGQMRQNYSNENRESPFLSFPTPDKCKRCGADGPWKIEFTPQDGGPDFWIHKMEENGRIIFSDGTMTAGRKHWSEAVKTWCISCDSRQRSPKFDFAE